jgi:hypothetical protein
MAVASKDSSGAGSRLSVRVIEVTDLEDAGLSDATSGAATVYSLDLDNSAVGAITYFRMYDSGAPTFGTTDSDVMIQVAANTRQVWIIAQGLSFGTGVSLMASSADGPAGGTPGSAFNCSFATTA